MPVSLDLSAPQFAIRLNAGNDATIVWTVEGINTTGWTLEFLISLEENNGPQGTPIATITSSNGLTNTPGTNSTISVAIAANITAGMASVPLWGELWRTDSGNARTLSNGAIQPV